MVVVTGQPFGFIRLPGRNDLGRHGSGSDRLNRSRCCPKFFERRGGVQPDRGLARMINLESIALVGSRRRQSPVQTCVPTTSCSWAAPKRGSPRTRNSPQLISSNDTAIGSSACVSPNITLTFTPRWLSESAAQTARAAGLSGLRTTIVMGSVPAAPSDRCAGRRR